LRKTNTTHRTNMATLQHRPESTEVTARERCVVPVPVPVPVRVPLPALIDPAVDEELLSTAVLDVSPPAAVLEDPSNSWLPELELDVAITSTVLELELELEPEPTNGPDASVRVSGGRIVHNAVSPTGPMDNTANRVTLPEPAAGAIQLKLGRSTRSRLECVTVEPFTPQSKYRYLEEGRS